MDGFINENYIVFGLLLGILSFYPILVIVHVLKALIRNTKIIKRGQENYLNKLVETYYKEENIYPEPMSDAEFVIFISDYLLGEHWYTTDPISHRQVNVKRAEEIILKYKRKIEK